MNLISKSKRQLIRYIQLLRKNLKWSQEALNELLYDHDELKERLERTENTLEVNREYWLGRLREVEDMHSLQTANLRRHNEALGDLIVRSTELRLNPPIILKTNEPELECLRSELSAQFKVNAALIKEVNGLKTQIRNAAETLVKSL